MIFEVGNYLSFQISQIPIRDWNTEENQHEPMDWASKSHKSLLGIETRVLKHTLKEDNFQISQIPIRDWNKQFIL